MLLGGVIAVLINTAGLLIEYVGIVIIIVAAIMALVNLVSRGSKREKVRVELAKNIMFGLEFVIAADILLVTVATNLNDILQLSGVVIVRILLGYALKKENIK